MPSARRHESLLSLLRLVIVALFVAASVTGCGDDRPAKDAGPATTTVAERTTDGDTDADEDEVTSPTPAARAAGAHFDALVREYTPVSRRVNFLVTAETLREDAVASGAGDAVERERFGAVRIEIDRMDRVLGRSREHVASVAVSSVAQQHVQALMLEAIDSRARALGQLEQALDALGDDAAAASETEALEDRWHGSWDESLRAAREATTTMQQARAMLGLEPAAEDGIR